LATKKLQEFVYEKDGTKSTRKVIAFTNNDQFVEGIDLKELTPAEQADLISKVEKFEEDLAPYVNKGWRRFLKSKIS